MPEPKKRMSVSRSKKRRGPQFADTISMAKCPKCGKTTQAHRVCRACAANI